MKQWIVSYWDCKAGISGKGSGDGGAMGCEPVPDWRECSASGGGGAGGLVLGTLEKQFVSWTKTFLIFEQW